MALGGGMSCIKYLMFLFNFLFAITGLIIIVVSSKAIIETSPYIDFTGERFFSAAPIVLIIIGIIIFVVSFFGCFGAIKENRCLILTFATLLLIIFAAELGVGIAGYVKHKDLETSISQTLNVSMDHTDNPAVMTNFNIMQTDFKCCGVQGPNDWAMHKQLIPASCCNNAKEAPCDPKDPNLHQTGCFTALVNFCKGKAAYLGGVGIGIAIVQLLGVIFACCLQRAIGSEYETV